MTTRAGSFAGGACRETGERWPTFASAAEPAMIGIPLTDDEPGGLPVYRLFVALAFCILFAPCPASAVTIPTVPVGEVGNPNGLSGFGSVAYAYRIGTFEVTVAQYVDFLNAVAKTDTFALYHQLMASDLHIAGIARSGVPGNFSYTVIGSPSHPVTYVNWGDAARFANWMHNNQPSGLQDASTTEDGAYFLNGAISDAALIAVPRNAGAKWFIPSESEWYKAAYYQPAVKGGDTDGYWLYPTRTNVEPKSDQPPGDPAIQTNVGNLRNNIIADVGYNDRYAVTGSPNLIATQNYLTDVGAYYLEPNFYGTFDQGGNVGEWNEGVVEDLLRGLRGGNWDNNPLALWATTRGNARPTEHRSTYGFRMATTVPEPGTLALAALGILGLLIAARRRR